MYTYDEASGRQVGVFKAKAGPGGACSGPLAQGVTQVRFSPNGMLLCAGARKCGDIVCWDVRKPKQELGRMTRAAPTNQVCVCVCVCWVCVCPALGGCKLLYAWLTACVLQRIGFDIDASSTYLVTGSEVQFRVLCPPRLLRCRCSRCGMLCSPAKRRSSICPRSRRFRA